MEKQTEKPDNNRKPRTITPHIGAVTKKIITAPKKRENNCKSGMENTKGAGLEKRTMTQREANGNSGTVNTNGKVLSKNKNVMQPDKSGKSGTQNVNGGNGVKEAITTTNSTMQAKNNRKGGKPNAGAEDKGAVKLPIVPTKPLIERDNNLNAGNSAVQKKRDLAGKHTVYYNKKSAKNLPKGSIIRKHNNYEYKLNSDEDNVNGGTNNNNGGEESNADGKGNKTKISKEKKNILKCYSKKTYSMCRNKPKLIKKTKNRRGQDSAANDK